MVCQVSIWKLQRVPDVLYFSAPELATASQQSSRKFNKLEAGGANKSYDIRIENFDIAFGDK